MTEAVINLGPTASYAVREAIWQPTAGGEGLLTICLRKSAGGCEERAVYAVQEDREQEAPHGWRAFLLLKTTDPREGEVYGVVAGTKGMRCTCKAGSVRRHECRHEAALKALLQEGVL